MRYNTKSVRPSFYRCARAVAVAGLAAPLLIAATSVNIAPAQAVVPHLIPRGLALFPVFARGQRRHDIVVRGSGRHGAIVSPNFSSAVSKSLVNNFLNVLRDVLHS